MSTYLADVSALARKDLKLELRARDTLPAMLLALEQLAHSLMAKGVAFDGIVKSGRTHLQDATPIRLGQEFTAYGHTVQRHRDKLGQAADWLRGWRAP